MQSNQGKKGILAWLARHPVLAVLGIVFFVLLVAVAVAIYTSPGETITPQQSRRRPIIAGSSPPVLAAAVESETEPMTGWQAFLLGAILVAIGVAISLYVTSVITGVV